MYHGQFFLQTASRCRIVSQLSQYIWHWVGHKWRNMNEFRNQMWSRSRFNNIFVPTWLLAGQQRSQSPTFGTILEKTGTNLPTYELETLAQLAKLLHTHNFLSSVSAQKLKCLACVGKFQLKYITTSSTGSAMAKCTKLISSDREKYDH